MEDKINLLDLDQEDLQVMLCKMGEQKFRAKQIFQWVNKGIKDIDEMTNIKKELRDKLKVISYICDFYIQSKLISKIDGTTKYLFKLTDSNLIESVVMHYEHGISVCISTQVGCRMGCEFCASTKAGFCRNLSAGEILNQVLTIQKDIGKRINNIVLMGIGEPLDNYDNVIKFIKLVNHEDGLNIGLRHISLSTCGLIPQILKLKEENMQITLSISLHAPNDEIRKKIMPIAKLYKMDELVNTCKEYIKATNRRITFEYALVKGLNDSVKDAQELAGKLKGMICHVNLIPVNSIEEGGFVKSNKEEIDRFRRILKSRGIETTVRRELGSDINAACGQLRRSNLSDS